MRVKYTYKFRLRPSKTQRTLLSKHFGCTRYLYNYFLARRKQDYLSTGRSNNFVKDSKELTALKKTLTWLTEVGSQCLQQAIRNLDAAYGNFFAGRANFPRFKTKHDKQAFRAPQKVKIKGDRLSIQKFREGIPMVLHRQWEGRISHCTITKNKSGQYHCCLLVERDIEPLPESKKEVGIDLGINTLIVDSDGKEYANIRPYQRMKRKIKKVQRKLSKRRNRTTNKNSRRIEKLRLKLAKVHQKVKDVRNNHVHQATKKLIDENQVICVETLAVKNMMKNHRLAGAIADCSWFEIRRQLTYKAAWYGRRIVRVDRFFPSSKTCSSCGHIKQDLRLGDREWECPACGERHGRDHNAAKMVLKQGQVQLRAERPKVKPVDSGTIRLIHQSAEGEAGSRPPRSDRQFTD